MKKGAIGLPRISFHVCGWLLLGLYLDLLGICSQQASATIRETIDVLSLK